MFSGLTDFAKNLIANKLIRRVIKNSGYLFSATGVSAAMSMLQSILAARLLGVATFGVLGAITMFTSVVNKLVSFRMSELVIKYVGHFSEANDHQKAAAVFKLAGIVEMLASIFAFCIVVLLAPLGAQYFAKDTATTPYFALYGLIVLANLVSESSTGLLQIFDKFKPIAILNVIQSATTLALTSLAYFFSGGLKEVLIAYLAGKAIGALGLTVTSFNEAGVRWGKDWWKTRLSILHSYFRELGGFAINTNISATISLVTKDSELLWVSFFRNPTETGYYKLALSLANILQLPVSPLPQATYPELSRQAARRRWDNMRDIMKQGSFIALGYSAFATFILILVGKPLISTVYSAEFSPAFPALVILLMGFLVSNAFYWRRPALLALGHADFPAKLNTFLALLKTVGIVLLLPHYGYLASAALLAGFYGSVSILSTLKIRHSLSSLEHD